MIGAHTGRRSGAGVPPRTNLLTINQSSVETDLTGWAAWDGTITLSRVTTRASHGTASMEFVKTGAGSSRITTPTGVLGIPVTAGLYYAAKARVCQVGGISKTMFMFIEWFTAAGASNGIELGPTITFALDGVFQDMVHNGVVAPANTAFARLRPQSGDSGTYTIGMDSIQFEQVAGSGVSVPAFN